MKMNSTYSLTTELWNLFPTEDITHNAYYQNVRVGVREVGSGLYRCEACQKC